MKNPQAKTTGSYLTPAVRVTCTLLALTLFAAISRGGDNQHRSGDGVRPPYVPADLEVPAGNQLASRATGVGVQIYVWTINPTNAALASWVFKAPHAVLFSSHEEERGAVAGIHFAGPTWEDNDGGKVAGLRVAANTLNSNAIPWLLLQGTNHAGAGLFTSVTYIQRLNTFGGLAPTEPGNVAGEEALVPYIADYYFYRAEH